MGTISWDFRQNWVFGKKMISQEIVSLAKKCENRSLYHRVLHYEVNNSPQLVYLSSGFQGPRSGPAYPGTDWF